MNKEEIKAFMVNIGDYIETLQIQLTEANEKLEKIKKLLADNEYTKVNDENGIIVFYTSLKEIIKGSDIK